MDWSNVKIGQNRQRLNSRQVLKQIREELENDKSILQWPVYPKLKGKKDDRHLRYQSYICYLFMILFAGFGLFLIMFLKKISESGLTATDWISCWLLIISFGFLIYLILLSMRNEPIKPAQYVVLDRYRKLLTIVTINGHKEQYQLRSNWNLYALLKKMDFRHSRTIYLFLSIPERNKHILLLEYMGHYPKDEHQKMNAVAALLAKDLGIRYFDCNAEEVFNTINNDLKHNKNIIEWPVYPFLKYRITDKVLKSDKENYIFLGSGCVAVSASVYFRDHNSSGDLIFVLIILVFSLLFLFHWYRCNQSQGRVAKYIILNRAEKNITISNAIKGETRYCLSSDSMLTTIKKGNILTGRSVNLVLTATKERQKILLFEYFSIYGNTKAKKMDDLAKTLARDLGIKYRKTGN
ncbi:hypothetical protein [Snodgrassella communis]|uniref:Uncharacterized protein n=1 Tax=Snodgrassella alvi TaxID=1196083 RepID=A0A2N9XTK2_9NEIS|nr:hypothetical protein [Snodgrassella communis]PIT52565.1 hypothetical protein BHC48_02035 [Snodgrassella communis]